MQKLGHVYAGNPYSLHSHSLFVAYCKSVETECGGSEGSAGQADHRTRTGRPPLTIAARIVCAPRSSFVPRRVGEKGLMYPATARDRPDSSTAGCRRKQGHCLAGMSTRTANWAMDSLLRALAKPFLAPPPQPPSIMCKCSLQRRILQDDRTWK